jgi:hypothetical protein
MDCHRMFVGKRMAENLANEVIHASVDSDGKERAPMRLAEARITLDVVTLGLDAALAHWHTSCTTLRPTTCPSLSLYRT